MAFYVVYIQEAHPSDGWVMRNNVQAGITVATPLKFGERIETRVFIENLRGLSDYLALLK